MRIIPHGDSAFAMGDPEDQGNLFEQLSGRAQDHLSIMKSKLPQWQRDILIAEEKVAQLPVDEKYTLAEPYGKPAFYTIKDGVLQDYLPVLDGLLNYFYAQVARELITPTPGVDEQLLFEQIYYRKELVKQAIIQKIRDFQMDKLISTYSSGESYPAAPFTLACICRGEQTYISHIFKPSLDMNIVARVGGSYGGGRSVSDICISKDVFAPLSDEEKTQGENYLAELLGYKTRSELVDTLEVEAARQRDLRDQIALFALSLKKILDDTN